MRTPSPSTPDTRRSGFSRSLAICCLGLLTLTDTVRAATPMLAGAERVLFLGDSITFSGQYVEWIEAYLVTRFPDRPVEILNLGLPSETVSGLSEEGHAGGQFPRPDLHERLGRVLDKTTPNVVLACYGMNDGIYLPFAQERFAAFTNGLVRLRMLGEHPNAEALLRLIRQKQRVLKEAWLTETGHKRPGINKGLPLVKARPKAEELEKQIRALAKARANAGVPETK